MVKRENEMLTQQLNIRIEAKLYERLRRVTDKETNWAAPSMSSIVHRGIELALGEMGHANANVTDAAKRKQRVRK